MPQKDPRVDAYIADAADFAAPVLSRFRSLVHQSSPDITETIKWNSPFFEYNKGLLCGMVEFKAHCALLFWNGGDLSKWMKQAGQPAIDFKALSKITGTADLPSDKVLLTALKAAMEFRSSSNPKAKQPRKPAKEIEIPADLKKALASDKQASTNFKKFPPSHRREYVEWITEAKRPETREKRIKTAIEWLSEGKQRNWKYM